MALSFSGFPRTVDRRALRPGRWFLAQGPGGGAVCMLTALGQGGAALVLTLSLRRLDALELRAPPLASLIQPLQTLEDDLVFSPGDGEEPRLGGASVRAPVNGALLRLSSGDMGMALTDETGALRLVSLASGDESASYDLVFERWSLFLRRGTETGLVGRFRPEPRMAVGGGLRPGG